MLNSTPSAGVYRFDRFRLDPVRRILSTEDSEIHLPSLQFELLLLLAAHSERLVTKAEIRDTLWPGRTVDDSNLKQCVFGLRQALAKAAPQTRFITAISGRGYRFVVPVVTEFTAATPPEPLGAAAPAPPPRKRLGLVGVALLGLGLLVFAGSGWALVDHASRQHTIVSARFENRTGEAAFDHVPEVLIRSDLARSPSLNLVSESRVRSALAFMRAPPDSPLTAALASEVCKRINGDAVIDGSIDRLGAKYILVARATDCVTGRLLTTQRTEFSAKEEAPAAIDRTARDLRRALKEPFWTLIQKRAPIDQRVTTSSFDALQAYSQALYLGHTGHVVEEEPLLQQAVALDPSFASAWVALAIFRSNSGDDAGAAAAIRKAEALRGGVSPREALKIDIEYDSLAINDPWAAIRTLKTWLAFHGADAKAWCDLGRSYIDAAAWAPAIAPLEKCVGAGAAEEGDYANLMLSLSHQDRIAEARQAAADAKRLGMSSSPTERRDADLAFIQGDPDAILRLAQSVRDKPSEPWVLYDAVEAALAQGQVRRARDLEQRAAAAALRGGNPAFNTPLFAVELIELGYGPEGAALIAALPQTADPTAYNYALAFAGDPGQARTLLQTRLVSGQKDPVLIYYDAPRVRAALLAREGRLNDALGQFKTGEDLSDIDFGMDYQHGVIALAAGKPGEAAAAFRDILDHPGRDPVSPRTALARLGLARALAAQGQAVEAHAAYQALFKIWRDANRDLPVLVAAQAEDQRLRAKLNAARPG